MVHLQKQLVKLKQQTTNLSEFVEEHFSRAVYALVTGDSQLATQIVHEDIEIDQLEIELEEECLKILALYQPVAVDLRFIISVLKINNDLERIGDLAADIAEITRDCLPPSYQKSIDFTEMIEKVRWMVKNCLASLITMDAQLARRVCDYEDQVYNHFGEISQQIQTFLEQDGSQVKKLLGELTVAGCLKAISVHARKIAEDVIYTTEAVIVRHHSSEIRG